MRWFSPAAGTMYAGPRVEPRDGVIRDVRMEVEPLLERNGSRRAGWPLAIAFTLVSCTGSESCPTAASAVVATSCPKLVAVPDVTGLSLGEAKALLRERGLAWDVEWQGPRRGGAAGTVVSQFPPAGDDVRGGTFVELETRSRPKSG